MKSAAIALVLWERIVSDVVCYVGAGRRNLGSA